MAKNKSNYTAKDIYVLEGLEPVCKRPGMYIGSTCPDGLRHIFQSLKRTLTIRILMLWSIKSSQRLRKKWEVKNRNLYGATKIYS